ncbi:hypothetical protein SAMD00019534_021430, partial [Acytostelium subglobosum LB1]|uniref:hypothetical protein n=1 Tax=Acytostelium subglobosum LB1 TaxID=1410327 RepID=UPI000644A079
DIDSKYIPKLLDPLNTLSTTTTTVAGGYSIIDKDLQQMSNNIIDLLTNGFNGRGEYGRAKATHPYLASIATYYFQLKGKRIRPTLIMLMSRALSPNGCLTSDSILLAQVYEMMHTASLVHDDVLDEATTRRDMKSINMAYSNKLAILCGDYLLARSSGLMTTLKNPEVHELFATVLAELVEGEIMQIKSTGLSFDNYLRKTYLKTATLITNACRSSALLCGCDRATVDIATEFGSNIGMALQIVDDLLDFTSSPEELGKDVLVDLSLGLATAPVLYAAEEYPELEEMVNRRFSATGDVVLANELVLKSNGLVRTRGLAIEYCNKAIQCLLHLPSSESRDLLITLAQTMATRNK